MTRIWFAALFLFQVQVSLQVEPGAITGRLLSPNGLPAAGVRIAAVPAEGADKATANVLFGLTQTDADGKYRIENIPAGRYYIFAGLIDLPSYFPNAKTLDRATAVRVDSGATVSGIDFVMARPTRLTVAGRVDVPSTLQSTAGSTMMLTPSGTGATVTSLQTPIKQDGSFEFSSVAPGQYRLTSNLRGSSPITVVVDDLDLRDVVLPVVDCNAGAQVRGRLAGNSRNTITTISLTGSRAGCALSTRVERDGTFAFNGVPEGTYQIQLTPAPLGWIATRVTVEKTNLDNVEVSLPPSITVKGQATIEDGVAFPQPGRGAPVIVQAAHNSGVVTAPILADGTFELTLPKGRYRISVPGIPSGYFLRSMTAGLTDLTTIAFEVSESPPEIAVVLAPARRSEPSGVKVAGQLRFSSTGALPNSEGVLLVSTTRSRNPMVRETSLSPDGLFEFVDVPPGTYNIETYPDSPAALYGIVVDKADVTGIQFVVPPLIRVKGGIEWSDSSGQSVAPVRPSMSVQFTRKEGNKVVSWGALAQSGAFHFYLPVGEYQFSVSDIPANFDLNSVTSGDSNILEDGLRILPDSDPPSLRVKLRGR